nr:hypothetical protein [Tanacetum cinerariifolium]
MTGLAGGAVPRATDIALSLDRLRGIEEIDTAAATVTVRAGTTLQEIQQAVADAGYLFPLDLGARGSCQIGGNIATNAGGNAVIRYGMTRDLRRHPWGDYPCGVEDGTSAGAVHHPALRPARLRQRGRNPVAPMPDHHPLYVLLESSAASDVLEQTLEAAIEAGEVVDAILATSQTQARSLWKIREATGEFPVRLAPLNFDISLPIGQIGDFAD